MADTYHVAEWVHRIRGERERLNEAREWAYVIGWTPWDDRAMSPGVAPQVPRRA